MDTENHSIQTNVDKEKQECEFCHSEFRQDAMGRCRVCTFPDAAPAEEREKFIAEHEDLKVTLDEFETALSWARFGMLWPWLTAIAIAASYDLRKPVDIPHLIATVFTSSMFIAGYYFVRKNAVLVLGTLWFTYVVLLIATTIHFREILSFNSGFLAIAIIPVILLLMYSNAFYLAVKTHFALKKLRGMN